MITCDHTDYPIIRINQQKPQENKYILNTQDLSIDKPYEIVTLIVICNLKLKIGSLEIWKKIFGKKENLQKIWNFLKIQNFWGSYFSRYFLLIQIFTFENKIKANWRKSV